MGFKKIILVFTVIFTLVFVRIDIASAKAASPAAKKPAAKTTLVKKKKVAKKTVAAKTTLKWSADASKMLGRMGSFDYSYTIRNAVIKKIENYARRKNIKVITAAVINSMNE